MKKLISINDLKSKELKNEELTPQQRLALRNFERFRTRRLEGIKDEQKFHLEFQRMQSLANLNSYEEYLKEEYC